MVYVHNKNERFKKWLRRPPPPCSWLYSKFETLHETANIEDAFYFVQKALVLYPKYERLWLRYLDVLFWYNRMYQLLEVALKIKDIFPDSFDCTAQLARAYLYNGDAQQAAQLLRRPPDTSASTPPWWLMYQAQAEVALGNPNKALKIYTQTVIQWPTSLPMVFRELVTYLPESSEIVTFSDIILNTIHDERIYSFLLYNRLYCFDKGHPELLRERLLRMIEALLTKAIPIKHPEENYTYLVFNQYALFNQNINDRILRKKLATLYMQSDANISAYSAPFREIKKKTRLRVGIAATRFISMDKSTTFYTLFKHFDTNRFELILFVEKNLLPKKNTPAHVQYEHLCSLFSKIIIYEAAKWKEYKHILLQEKLDIYMGENIINLSLSMAFFSRFAPVQINAWDRCDSFGAPHTDYFLIFGGKNKLTEWAGYIEEKYAIISQNYTAPAPKRAKPSKVDYAALKLPKGPFFFYPQTLFRLLPQEDHIIATLLRNNPDHYFLGLSHTAACQFIWYRWKKTIPDCAERIKILSYPQPLPTYLGLVSEASVLLGSLKAAHGGISSSTIFSLGLPIVVGFGDHWSSCITSFQYEQMGVRGLVASSHEEYIAIAQRLIDEPDWKEKKMREIKENSHKTNNIPVAAQEIQNFLVQAYTRARLGIKPEHWQHEYFIH